MSWKDIVKGEKEYTFYLEQIEKIENMLERIYDDIEKAAVEMSEKTELSLEQARNIIKNIQKDTINRIEETLQEFKDKLENQIVLRRD
tara:strand:+ start:396 stop:659 length:264 start_codon:yes stop_codon:yes gene_type:complete